MKHIGIISLITIGLFSCNSKRDIDADIKQKMADFYNGSQVKDYKPISYSTLDTIQNIKNLDGSIIRLTGTIIHDFSARSNNGSSLQYTDTFEVTIFEDEVIVIPQGY